MRFQLYPRFDAAALRFEYEQVAAASCYRFVIPLLRFLQVMKGCRPWGLWRDPLGIALAGWLTLPRPRIWNYYATPLVMNISSINLAC